MRMTPKLLLSMVFLVALALGVTSAVSLVHLNAMTRRLTSVDATAVKSVSCAQEMNSALDEMRIAILAAIDPNGMDQQWQLAQAMRRRDQFEAAWNQYQNEFAIATQSNVQDLLQKYGVLDRHSVRENDRLTEVKADFPLAKSIISQIEELLKQGKQPEAREIYFQQGYPLFERINTNVEAFCRLQLEESDYAAKESQAIAASLRRELLAAVIIIMSASIVIATLLSRAITKPLRVLIEATAAFAKGDFSKPVVVSSRDEIGELAKAMGQMARDLCANQHIMREAQRKIEASSEAKSAFLANMSHEIRTPMNAILGYSERMLKPAQSQADRMECVQVIRRNGRHLLDLINDVLDISKIEAGKMSVERIDVDLQQVVAEALSMMRPRAHEKGLKLHAMFRGELPRTIQTDPLRLKQILVNLIGNATKFTTSGEVTLTVSCQQCSHQASTVQFDVADTGVGMTSAQVNELFQPFTQADQSTTRRFGGTGLGLSISKKLAELLGGDITVSSEVARGSTFTLIIDAGILADVEMVSGLTESQLRVGEDAAPVTTVNLNCRILLAEDGRDNQKLISAYLREAGADVTIAENGRLAVELARKQMFDLILMDMQMPEMDGYAATSDLRHRGYRLPIIALTAHAMSGDREKCLSCGCTDYLTKPIDGELLLRTVAKQLRAHSSESAASSTKPLRSSMADHRIIKELLPEFVAGLPNEVNKLLTLSEEGTLQELRRVAHQLKGGGAGYGFSEITNFAARAEQAIDASESVDRIRSEIEALIHVLRRVEGYDSSREKPYEPHSTHHR